jgi:hypothetical protein
MGKRVLDWYDKIVKKSSIIFWWVIKRFYFSARFQEKSKEFSETGFKKAVFFEIL